MPTYDPSGTLTLEPASVPPEGTAAYIFYTLGAPVVNLDTGASLVIAGSVQDVFVPVSLTDAAAGSALDPTTIVPVQMAFTTGRDPQEADWTAAAWMTRTSDGAYFATASVAALAPAAYAVFLRTADGTISLAPGTLVVR